MSETEQKPEGEEMQPEAVPLVVKEKSEKAKSQQAMSEKAKSEKEEEKKLDDGETAISDEDLYMLSPCCCCMCACSHKRVGDATCFGCLPIRCGIMFIAILIFALAITLISITFFQLLNEYLPWWYCFITLILLAPIAIAASFMVYFFAKDSKKTRVKLFVAIMLSTISIGLWAVWNLIFFLAIYKRDIVYSGMGPANDESNYHATPKRTYLFTILAEATFMLIWLAYFTCVSNEYCDLMNEKYDREQREVDRVEAEKKQAAADKKKKEDDERAEKKRLENKNSS